eukprot:CAMPEP_0117048134 /NCGR_PEP_ID=MMETSP0472-20121206/33259_1 /TAXON_ID=693140 ORGANISM="Tiarina fusus, Strain LIS" /NCGR_SAMPLE_ID=MMETSP0472 /ASSEMBLY_ACC=CAM_ASM_000603 /LENGTH=418 /DNA_ID=CAMNT_0004761089 /DNA_START=197 /DNA_END=1453 /DNA_ORIENTATION=+
MDAKVNQASELFEKHFRGQTPTTMAVAPGRVNLIGEHTDYTGGFVLPFAIDYSTVAYGSGTLKAQGGASRNTASASVDVCSANFPEDLVHLDINPQSTPPENPSWTTYVGGVVFQYLPDFVGELEMSIVISGDVPLGSGLSSSASLEVAVARFVEDVLGDAVAFSSEPKGYCASKVRALRCQRAENTWCQSPCGIMDQFVSSAATAGSLLLIDCTSLEFQLVDMAQMDDTPILVVANSNVQHDIAGGEYPIRVKQCQQATQLLQKANINISTLREASFENLLLAKDLMDDVSFRRAKHVVTENARTVAAKRALKDGDWKQVGALMNVSHASMKEDYEVSCDEIDYLVELAQGYSGVFGSRLTGGGFGGCTVTLVSKEHAPGLIQHLKTKYKSRTGKECICFETMPSQGAHTRPIDASL